MATILPAVVQISDLPAGTTLSGTELLEAVQTSGGVGQSVQITVNQIATTGLGALPTGGNTGQFLQKSNANNFASNWVNIASSVLAGTGLAQAGTTTVTLSIASTAGLSVLGVGASGSAIPAAIAGTADQVFIVNHAGSSAQFGAVNLATTAAVTGVLPNAQMSAVNLGSTGAGGIQGFLPGTSIATASIASAQIATAQVFTTQLQTAAGLSVLAVNSSGATNFSVVSGTADQVLLVNHAATGIVFGAVNLATSAAVTGFLPGTNIATAGIGTTQLQTAAALSVLAVNSSGATNFSVVSGAAGQSLGVNPAGTGIVFQGGMVLLNTLSPSNVATTGDTTSLTSTFRNYMVTFENVVPATTATLQLEIATSGTAFVSGGYISQAQVNVGSTIVTDLSSTVILLSGTRATTQIGSTTTYGVHGFIKIFNPANTVFRKTVVGDLAFLTPGASTTTLFAQAQIAGYFDTNSNAVTGIQFNFNTGNIATGTIRIYGIF